MTTTEVIIILTCRREQWKQRQEEKKLLEEALLCQQKVLKERAEAEASKCSLGACLVETAIICKLDRDSNE